ncbi:hypothetical protein BH11CYA1_BH11CYA1_49250 [soil metagenome]
MLTMTPLAVIAENEYAPGFHRYRVRFDYGGKEVEYTFTVDDRDEIIGVKADEREFSIATIQDPLMPQLMQCILALHEARRTAPK